MLNKLLCQLFNHRWSQFREYLNNGQARGCFRCKQIQIVRSNRQVDSFSP